MYYVVQENVFKEQNYDNLIKALDKLRLDYEIIKIIPFVDDIPLEYCKGNFNKFTNVFPFGAIKLSNISKKFKWNPGSLINENHDFKVYSKFYKDNLLNHDSKIIKFGDDNFFSKQLFFARPTKDTKEFTGKVFDMKEWIEFKQYSLINGHSTLLNKNTDIQISTVKNIQKEYRFWIVNGKIITASLYRLNNVYHLDDCIEESAIEFVNKMIDLFQLDKAFVMDICLVKDEWKIIECGCINCAGFYKADLQKLLSSLENCFNLNDI